ncbi:MAG TPA: MFS transporter [Anaerolineae bacterium]|nr:MFS transporter [Anaerolineae bacterium]
MRIPLLTWQPGVQTGHYLVRFLLLVILVRLVRDTSIRMMYPFLNEYAQGLGVTLATMGMLLMLRTWLVVLAPLFGHRADRIGPKRILMAGFGLQGLGLLGMGLASGVWSAAAAILVLGVSDAITYPLMQAYISEQAPQRHLGRALITVEYSWAMTGIVILPIIGWLIGDMGWQTPFRVLSMFSGVAVLILALLLPRSHPNPNQQKGSFWKQIRVVARDRSALGSVLVSATIFIAAEAYFVTWGAHLARDFALTPERIGQVAAGLGVIELFGSVLASFIIDPLGKRRGVIAGVLFFLGALIALIWLERTLWTTLLGMGLVSLAVEYSIVSTIPLMAQQLPASRATVLALGAMAGAFTRSLTDPAATWLLEHGGFLAAMAYSFLALAVALGFLWRWVQERATSGGTKSSAPASY